MIEGENKITRTYKTLSRVIIVMMVKSAFKKTRVKLCSKLAAEEMQRSERNRWVVRDKRENNALTYPKSNNLC